MKAINKEEIKSKVEHAKWRAKGNIYKAVNWAKDHPEATLAIIGTGIGAAKYFGKAAIKDIRTNREEALLRMRCYDPSKGHYYYLKRELTNKEWLMVDRRREAGEKLADILDEMRVLK